MTDTQLMPGNRRAESMGALSTASMLDHVIPLNERHLMRLSQNYLSYYHEDRTHRSAARP